MIMEHNDDQYMINYINKVEDYDTKLKFQLLVKSKLENISKEELIKRIKMKDLRTKNKNQKRKNDPEQIKMNKLKRYLRLLSKKMDHQILYISKNSKNTLTIYGSVIHPKVIEIAKKQYQDTISGIRIENDIESEYFHCTETMFEEAHGFCMFHYIPHSNHYQDFLETTMYHPQEDVSITNCDENEILFDGESRVPQSPMDLQNLF